MIVWRRLRIRRLENDGTAGLPVLPADPKAAATDPLVPGPLGSAVGRLVPRADVVLVIVELVGGPLDGLELDVPLPPPGLVSVPLLDDPQAAPDDPKAVATDPDPMELWATEQEPDQAAETPVPVYHLYRRRRDLSTRGRMLRYTYMG